MFYIYQMPVPRLADNDAQFAPIVERAAKLICTTPEFDDLAREVGLRGHEDGATDPAERARLRAELDALVARLYGLTEDEFAHILATFPLVADKVKADTLAAFCVLTPTETLPSSDPLSEDTALLIRQRENEAVEFKRTLEYVADADLAAKKIPLDQKSRIQKDVTHSALKTICAFLNSSGGTLLIGAHDEGYAVGIENDLSLFREGNRTLDNFELKLRGFLSDRFTPIPLDGVSVRFPIVDGKTLCRVDVTAAARNISHLDSKVYVRHGNQTLELTGTELTHWIRRRTEEK